MVVGGEAEPVVAPDAVIDEYEREYAFGAGPAERWHRLLPRRAYARREADFPATVTRFDFE